jgi:polysaccharide export outer membrane protein
VRDYWEIAGIVRGCLLSVAREPLRYAVLDQSDKGGGRLIPAGKTRANIRVVAFVLLLFAGRVAHLSGQVQVGYVTPTADTVPAANGASISQPALSERNPRYVIQRQDVLSLSFPLSVEMNQTVTVQPDGYINLQNGSSLLAQGLTVPQLVDAVKGAYAGTLHNPIVIVDLKDFQKPFFTVTGQVGKPGQYELRAAITVAEAIAVAGGLAPTAKSQIFLFHRTSDQWFEVKKVNLKDLMHGKKVNENATLKPGDMIFVPETFITNFRKYVPYSLNAGTYLSNGPL